MISRLLPSLPAIVAATTLALTSCSKTPDRVAELTQLVQPDKEDLSAAEGNYNNQRYISLTQQQKESLKMTWARLKQLGDLLKDKKAFLSDLILIMQSPYRIVTRDQTMLRTAHSFSSDATALFEYDDASGTLRISNCEDAREIHGLQFLEYEIQGGSIVFRFKVQAGAKYEIIIGVYSSN